MKSSDFSKDELAIIEGATTLYDKFGPVIKKKVKEPSTWLKLQTITKAFMLKNQEALSTNIIGKQVIVNSNMEEGILDALGVSKAELRETIKSSEYFKRFGELQMTDQLCLGVPLILAAIEYKRINKKEESKLAYLLAFYKPYASRCSQHFKYPPNEGQMAYTVEHFTDRFDIKKYGTLANVIVKRAESSYENYVENASPAWIPTDKELHVIYTSGIATRMYSFLKAVFEEYRKNAGKEIDFESSSSKLRDKDTDADEYFDADIESNVSIKSNEVGKVMAKISQGKADPGLASIAAQFGFSSSNSQYQHMVIRTVEETIDKMYSELPLFFSSLIGSFLFRVNPKTGERYGIKEFRSPVFINVGVDILAGKKSNLKDTDMLKARELFKKMLSQYSIDYKGFKDTYKKKLEKALALYWVLTIKK